MQFLLACAAPHGAIPALVVGDRLTLVGEGVDLELRMKVTPALLDRLLVAIQDGALVVPPEGPRPTFEQIAAFVEERRDALLAQLEAKAAKARTAHAAA